MPHKSIHATVHLYVPIHLFAPPYPLYICMFHLYHMFPICHGTWEASVHPICHGVFWEHQYICQAFLSCCFTGLNACGSMLCFMLLTCSFLCSVSLCLKLLLLWLQLLLLWWLFCPPVHHLLSTGTNAPYLMGLSAIPGQHAVVLPPLLTVSHSGGVLGLAIVPKQQPPSHMPLQAYAKYGMGPPRVGFPFRVEHPTVLVFICLVSILLSGAMLDAVFIYGAQPLGFAPLQPFGPHPWQAYVQPSNGHQPKIGMQSGCSLHCFL